MAAYVNVIYGISIFFIGLIGFASVRHKWRLRINRTLLFFCLATIGWATALYLGFHFSISGNIEVSTLFIRGSFAFGTLFIFLLSRFIYLFPLKSILYPRWAERLSLIANTILIALSLFTPLIYKRAAQIIDGVQVGEELGSLYLISVVYILLNYAFQIHQSVVKIKRSRDIERKKIIFSFSGLFAFLFILVLTNLILPIFGIYLFQQESVIFTFLFLIPTFYAITKYRFLDIKFTLSKTFIYVLSIIIAGLVSLGTFFLLKWLFPTISLILNHVISLLILFVVYQILVKILNSSNLRKTFEHTHIDLFREQINGFINQKKFYGSLQTLQKDLKLLFSDQLHIKEVELYLLKSSDFPKLRAYFLKNSSFLVTKEVEFLQKENGKKQPYYKELKGLGELCFPLYKNWEMNSLFAFFVLEKKNRFDDLYTKEELEILEQLSHNLSIALLGILYNAHLHKEVNKKTKEVKDMLMQQSDFVTASTHELRTPLSASIFQAQYLADGLKEIDFPELIEKQKEAEQVVESLQRLQEITGKIFDVQAYDRKKIKLFTIPTNLDDFVKIIYHKFVPLMKKKELRWEIKSKLPTKFIFEFDPNQIEKVLTELITNAIHFTPAKGSITLKIYTKKDCLYFEVIDKGEGIPDEQKKNIFKKFKTNHNMQSMGIGLGLYVVKKAIELHGGEIWVEDTPEGGATFVVKLSNREVTTD